MGQEEAEVFLALNLHTGQGIIRKSRRICGPTFWEDSLMQLTPGRNVDREFTYCPYHMDTECFWLFPVETWWPLENLLWQLLCRSKSSLPLPFLTVPFATDCLVALSLEHQESLERAALGPWQFLVQNGLGPLDFCLFCRVMESASYGALIGLGLSFSHVGPGILRSFRSVSETHEPLMWS